MLLSAPNSLHSFWSASPHPIHKTILTCASMAWNALSRRFPAAFNETSKPVWLTLFPLIAGGCMWAGYVGGRTLFGHNEIVISSKAEEPYLLRDSPKLLSRQKNISTHQMYEREMDGGRV